MSIEWHVEEKIGKRNGFKTIQNLYSEQQDFIVISLCGKTGSGCTTTADILHSNFSQLGLPLDYNELGFPASDNSAQELYYRSEYHILRSYAEENWNSFYKIKTQALITARILDGKTKEDAADKFLKFLDTIGGVGTDRNEDSVKKIKAFFSQKMEFYPTKEFCFMDEVSLSELLTGKDIPENCYLNIGEEENEHLTESETYTCEIGEANWDTDETKTKIEISVIEKGKENESLSQITLSKSSSEPSDKYSLKNCKCIKINNFELYKLFKHFQKSREDKHTSISAVYYWILQKWIYSELPKYTADLWKNVSELYKIQDGISTIALQLIGNNLRIGDSPYSINSGCGGGDKEVEFKKSAYTCIAKDINHAIKILRAYQWKKKQVIKRAYGDERIENTDIQKKYKEYKFNKGTLVVIDSIKNPYESMYLKQRYSNYFLIGVYTDEKSRKNRLFNSKKFAYEDIQDIDAVEQLRIFKERLKEYSETTQPQENPQHRRRVIPLLCERIKKQELEQNLPFILQNVSSCLESADIFLNNVDSTGRNLLELKYFLVRYVSLIMNPGLLLPTNLERNMQIAYAAKSNSGCISRQVGAVITDSNYRLLTIGWNQQPPEQIPCIYRNLCTLNKHPGDGIYSDFEVGYNDSEEEREFGNYIETAVKGIYEKPDCELIKNGKCASFCFKDIYNDVKGTKNQVHTRALHAEETAFLNLEGIGNERAKGGCLFTTSSPCELCSKKARYMNIAKIYYVEPYPDIALSHVLHIGLNKPEFILFTGAVGRAYTQLYTPLMAQKDEHEFWTGAKVVRKSKKNTDPDEGKR